LERFRQGDNRGGLEAFGNAAKIAPESPRLVKALMEIAAPDTGEANIKALWEAAILRSDVGIRVADGIMAGISPDDTKEKIAFLKSSAYGALERALDLDNGWKSENAGVQTRIRTANLAHDMEEYKNELFHLEVLSEEFDNSSWYRFRIGFARMKQKNYMAAIKSFSEAERLNADWGNASLVLALTNIGVSFIYIKAYDNACDILERTLEIDQRNRRAAIYWSAANKHLVKKRHFPPVKKAWKHLRAGEIEKGAAEFNRASYLLPGYPEVSGQLASALTNRNDVGEFLLKNDNAAILIEKGANNSHTAKNAGGRLYRASISEAADTRTVFLGRASLLYDFAVRNIGNASRNVTIEILKETAEFRLRQGENGEALILLKRLIPYFDNASFLFTTLGDVAVAVGNSFEAAEYYARAIDLDNEWRGTPVEKCFLALGRVYEKMKKFIDARKTYGAAAVRFPDSRETRRGYERANAALPPADRIPFEEFMRRKKN
ncbi:MAG: tetratricopeptide repeat protein, partial [Planctomycetota bacterium]